MASTNKTTHYELSQYVGTDKPTYLTDYNNDMSAIDTGIYNAQTKADSAYTAAGVADGKAGDAQTTANSALTNAGTANTNIGTMANLNTTDKTSLVGAINENKRNIDNMNLSIFESPTNVTVSAGSVSFNDATIAKNTDGSMAKIYGTIEVSNIPTNTDYVDLTFTTTLRPESNININNLVFGKQYGTGTGDQDNIYQISLSSSGVVSCRIWLFSTSTVAKYYFLPMLLFIKDFGDAPTPTP